jgi:SAM-dependent methyltransferase
MTVFGTYSQYYDLLYRDKDYDGEVQFVTELNKNNSLNANNLLELGCGTGIHAEKLATKGYSVQGVDLSSEMLKCAEDRLPNLPEAVAKRLSFSCGDICRFRHSGEGYSTFDVVLSLFHVISYQTTNENLLAAFRTAKVHLKRNGLFIFDCWYGPATLTDRPSVRIKRMDDEKVSITRIAEPVLHPNENCVDVHYTVWICDKQTNKVSEINETHRMRYLFKPEIEQLLALSGLSLINSQEWLSGNELGFNTWNGCFLAKNQ